MVGNIFIDNLPPTVRVKTLYALFRDFRPRQCFMVRRPGTYYGFVKVDNPKHVVKRFRNTIISGKKLRIRQAKRSLARLTGIKDTNTNPESKPAIPTRHTIIDQTETGDLDIREPELRLQPVNKLNTPKETKLKYTPKLQRQHLDIRDPLKQLIILNLSKTLTKPRFRNNKIEKGLVDVVKKEVNHFKIQEVNFEDIKIWIKKSFTYSYRINYQEYNYGYETNQKRVQKRIIRLFQNAKIKINWGNKRTKQYEYTHQYLKAEKTGKIIATTLPNRIIFFQPKISIFDVMQCINKAPVPRILRKGENIIEILGEEQQMRSIFRKCKTIEGIIPAKMCIRNFNRKTNKVEIIRGNHTNYFPMCLNVATFNANGLLNPYKKEILE